MNSVLVFIIAVFEFQMHLYRYVLSRAIENICRYKCHCGRNSGVKMCVLFCASHNWKGLM